VACFHGSQCTKAAVAQWLKRWWKLSHSLLIPIIQTASRRTTGTLLKCSRKCPTYNIEVPDWGYTILSIKTCLFPNQQGKTTVMGFVEDCIITTHSDTHLKRIGQWQQMCTKLNNHKLEISKFEIQSFCRQYSATVTGELHSTGFLCQWLSAAVQHGNAVCILCMCGWHELVTIFCVVDSHVLIRSIVFVGFFSLI